jgi:hypothetical protein
MAEAVATTLRRAVEHALRDGSGRTLSDSLYTDWYARWNPSAQPATAAAVLTVEALRAAHADSARFDDAWTATRVWPTGRVVAVRDGVERVLDPIDYVATDRRGLPPRAGGALRVTRRRDSVASQAGYWVAWGGAWGPPLEPANIVRLYWNVDAAGAPALVGALTGRLAERSLAYALKVPDQDAGFNRCDAAVLYLDRDDLRAAAPALRAAHAAVAGLLEAPTPALTRALAPGLGLAEEPPGPESFGGHRCRLIAEALAPALTAGEHDAEALLRAIAERLAAEGIALERPHLNPPGDHDLGGW